MPGASATYADFINASGRLWGTYTDAEGIFHRYRYNTQNGEFLSIDFADAENLEFIFIHGMTDVWVGVYRAKTVDDVIRTYVGRYSDVLKELQVPGSVSTEGWNINQDTSVVRYYETADGKRHGFIAKPIVEVKVVPTVDNTTFNYIYEAIEVPGVDVLAVTASSDFDDYAGYTRSAEGGKDIAFTLIDGVFETYDFPGSMNTYFYALGNNGDAAGYYEDSNGRHRGIVLQDGELRDYDFPGSVETEIWGISDTTGGLTGNFVDAAGVRRGFTHDEIIEVPDAIETYADFVSPSGVMVGSYIDADGVYHPYFRSEQRNFVLLDNLPDAAILEYFFAHGTTDGRVSLMRSKKFGDIPRTFVGSFTRGRHEIQVPGSVRTEGYNINADLSVVGHYEATDGRIYSFVARLADADTEPPVETTPTDPTQVSTQPAIASANANYTFETIEVPGVEYLAVTASSDFEDYAGNTRIADGEKDVGFTLIDGVFTLHDFPGAQGTYFYALGNNGVAAGHYQDSEGLYHGVILENGELRQYDFPGAVETEIYGYSDSKGIFTGHFRDASGVRRGFSGEKIVSVPEATATFADFVNAQGTIVGSYIDAQGLYHAYLGTPDGRFARFDYLEPSTLEYFFVHGINDRVIVVGRGKAIDDVPRTYVGSFLRGLKELQYPGSVSTEGWNINQDGSVVGHYDTADGRRHGFIAKPKPIPQVETDAFSNTYTVSLSKGLNIISLPLAPKTPLTAKGLVEMTGATTVITLDAEAQRFVAWTPGAPDEGFSIEGGHGYIVNVPETRSVAFVGGLWTDPNETAPAAPALSTEVPQEAWAFVVSGHLSGNQPAFEGYQVIVRNMRTNRTLTTSVRGDYFAAATADLARRSVVEVGDTIELRVIGSTGNAELEPMRFKVTPEHLANAVLSVRLDNIGQPRESLLLQNYPNPFNPETWIPYQLSEDTPVSISIYDTTGQLVRKLSLGFQAAGFYNSQGRAAYWDGRNAVGERVASGIYFYQLETDAVSFLRKMVILK